MADRRVTKTGKDKDGDITKLCGDWGSRLKDEAISDIELKLHSYYVNESGTRSDVYIVNRNGKKHLQTTPDKSSRNNLDNLPNC